MGFSRHEYWNGWPSPNQGNFLTQRSNPHLLWLLHCRWILSTTEPQGPPVRASHVFYYSLVPCAGPSWPSRRWGGVANTDTEPALTLRLALCLEPAVPPPRTLPSPTCCPHRWATWASSSCCSSSSMPPWEWSSSGSWVRDAEAGLGGGLWNRSGSGGRVPAGWGGLRHLPPNRLLCHGLCDGEMFPQ